MTRQPECPLLRVTELTNLPSHMNKPLTREQALAALAGQRFDVANLRVQIRIAEQLRERLNDYEQRWDRFV